MRLTLRYVLDPLLWMDLSSCVWLPVCLLLILHKSIRARIRFILTSMLLLLVSEFLSIVLGAFLEYINSISTDPTVYFIEQWGTIFLVVAYIPIAISLIAAARKYKPRWVGFEPAGCD